MKKFLSVITTVICAVLMLTLAVCAGGDRGEVPSVGTFLEHYDLTGYGIYPFSQSASMNTTQFDTSMEFVRGCAVGANVHDGLFARASSTTDINAYLTANGFIG